MASKGVDEAPADASAEESFKRYVEPVRVYNHIKNRARKNPLFLKRTVRYTKLHAIRNGADDADKQPRLELRVRCRYPKRAEHSDGPGGGRASNVDVVYAVLCVEKRPWTEWLGLIPKSNPKPEEKEESAAPIAVDASSDAAASPATEGSDAKKSPSSNANGDSVNKSTHGSPDGSSPAKFTGVDLSKASQPGGRVDPSFDDEGLNPDDRMFDDEDLDAPYVNVTALQCRRIKVVPGGEFDEKNYYDAVFDHPELSNYIDASSDGKPAEGQLRVAFVTWDGLKGLGDALCGPSHPTRNKCTLYARPKEGDEGIREHGIALGVIPQNARVRVSFCSAVPDGSCVRNPTGQSDVGPMRSHVIQPYPPVSDSPWTIHRNFLQTGEPFGDGSYESVELVFAGMSETDVVAASKGASVDPRDMSDAEAQAVPFVEFELSRHVPPTRNVEPETKLPGEQRAKGRVVFHYLYHGRQMRKTELTTGFTCPFCLCVNADFDGMSRHLEACHDAFNFEFLPKVQNEADPRVHVVCRSEEEVRSKNGSGEVRKESARRKEASEWFFKHGGWFVQSKAKVQMTHHEVGGDGGVVRKDVSPTCADREFVYASTRYRMPRWLQHQRSHHHASVSAPGPRGPYRRRIDKEVEKVAQLKQRAEAAEIQHQLKIQRHQLEQLQRHRHQQFAGRHRLVGDINHILTPQVHPGLLNHLMLNQGPGGQLGMQQGLQLGGQLGGLGGSAFAGGISGLNTGGMSGLSTNAAYGLGLAGMTPTHQLQQQQLQQQQMQQQQQLQQLLLRQQGHQQHQPFPPRKDVIRAWVEHRLQDVDPVALARELGITPREIEAGDSMIRELRGHMSILTEAHAAAGKVLYVPKQPKPKPTRPPIGPAYMAGVPPPDDDVRVRGDPSSPTNFVNLTTGAADDDDDVFEHDERVRHRRKTRDLNEVTRAAPRRYKKMEKWSTRDVGRPKKPKTTEVSGVKAPGLDFLMEAVTEDRGAEGADTAVRGKDKEKGAGKDKDKGAGKDKRKLMGDEDQPRQKRQYVRRDKPDKPAGSQPPAKRPTKCNWSKGIIGSHYDISEDPKKQAQWGGVGPPGTFYHAKTCVPIEPIVSPVNADEVNTDSDDDEDLHAWAKEDLRHLSDFEDVAPLEKKFMHDWNVFVRRFRPCADREIPDCLKAFARFKGKDLAGHRALRRLFTLHLINAYDFGVIESRVIDDVLKVVDEHRGDVKR